MEQNELERQAITDVLSSEVLQSYNGIKVITDAILQRLSELQPEPSEDRVQEIVDIMNKDVKKISVFGDLVFVLHKDIFYPVAREIASTEPVRMQPVNKTDDELQQLLSFIDDGCVEVNLYGNDGFDGQEKKDGKEYLKQRITEIASILPSSPSRENGVSRYEMFEFVKWMGIDFGKKGAKWWFEKFKEVKKTTYEQTDISALLPKPETTYTVTWTEKIRCPECHKIQLATVTETPLWNIYVHECECGNIIMESEWCVVNDN